jgi:hypothetical protein
MNSVFRMGLCAALLLTAFAVGSAAQTTDAAAAARVIFVCEHGAAKSVIATAYFNKMAAERGLPDRATSRGANPQAELSVSALKGLKEDSWDDVPEDQGYAAQRDAIKKHVERLIDQLQKR